MTAMDAGYDGISMAFRQMPDEHRVSKILDRAWALMTHRPLDWGSRDARIEVGISENASNSEYRAKVRANMREEIQKRLAEKPAHNRGQSGWFGESKRHSEAALKSSDRRDAKVRRENAKEFGR